MAHSLLQFQKNVSLKPYNTFGIEAVAAEFVRVTNADELKMAFEQLHGDPLFLLGGGSNLLLTQDLAETVIHLDLKGKKIVSETDHEVIVEAMAGENWHEFVCWTLEQGWGGLENLSLIPGNVGTTPVQNIGAYGVEIKDVMVQCTALEIASANERIFTCDDCAFGYRDSYFKQAGKGRYAIVSVQFRLTKNQHVLKTAYGDIQKELGAMGVESVTPQAVSAAVIAIRQSKLPDPKVLGNSGSFFKNPIIPASQYQDLSLKFPEMPHYPAQEGMVKVPAGWLIEQAGFKGKRVGDAGIHERQALVLVNYGGATGAELLALSQQVQNEVFSRYGIQIEAEVNVI